MKKIKLTAEQQKLFNTNFNRKAYEEAKKPIQEAISGSKSFDELWSKLQNHECDVEYEDDCTIISCEVELDRSHMETEGDYVGVCFYIKWYDEADSGDEPAGRADRRSQSRQQNEEKHRNHSEYDDGGAGESQYPSCIQKESYCQR